MIVDRHGTVGSTGRAAAQPLHSRSHSLCDRYLVPDSRGAWCRFVVVVGGVMELGVEASCEALLACLSSEDRRGAVPTPRILSGCYFWTWAEIRQLAEALDLRVPADVQRERGGKGGERELS